MADEHKWDIYISELERWLPELQRGAEMQVKNIKTLRALLKRVKDGRPS